MGEQASSIAGKIDALFWFLTLGSAVITGGIALALLIFSIRYRRRSEDEVPVQTEGALKLELTWTFVPLVLSIPIFFWGALLFVQMSRPDPNAMEIYVTGRQWMWKAQQPSGQWENNELHVPVGQPVTLNLTSIDVIHDFSVPAFRTKQDAVPGRYTTLSFTATKAGTYNLFCAEYCGTGHSRMIGSVTAMEPKDYETWLQGSNNSVSPAARGLAHFESYGCDTCHRADNGGIGPSLAGLYGQQEEIADGRTVTVDDTYIRESILNPQKDIVQGYGPPSRMPTFAGRVNETELIDLIAYIRSLGSEGQGGGSNSLPGTDATPGTGPNSSTDGPKP